MVCGSAGVLKPHGKGRCVYGTEGYNNDNIFFDKGEKGDKYEGWWVDGKWEGKGRLVKMNGEKYEGDWVGGKKDGKGELMESIGQIYEGEWVCGERQGKGRQMYNSGYMYDGDWVNDEPQGEGTLTDSNGIVVFNGKWMKSMFCFFDQSPISYLLCSIFVMFSYKRCIFSLFWMRIQSAIVHGVMKER
jgi:hypothetical protein